MIKISLKEAEGHLGELIEEAAAGQEVVITSDSGPTVRLMLVPQREEEDQRSVEAKLGYAAAKARALARLEHGYDLDWTPPASRDELHDR